MGKHKYGDIKHVKCSRLHRTKHGVTERPFRSNIFQNLNEKCRVI